MTQPLRRQGRPANGSEQRSVRVPRGLWPQLDKIARGMNRRRDPVTDGKITPSTLIAVAMREWLAANGHQTKRLYAAEQTEAA